MHSLLTSPLAKADSFSHMSGFESPRPKKKKNDHQMMVVFLLAAELGFEPRHTESESAVLPLHNSAIAFALDYCSTKNIVCQVLFLFFLKFFVKIRLSVAYMYYYVLPKDKKCATILLLLFQKGRLL